MNETDLRRLSAGADELSAAAAEGLADRAIASRLLDIAVGSVDSPIGRLTVAVTPRGLARLAFEDEDFEGVLAELARVLSPRILRSMSATQSWRRELEEFFDAKRTRFDLPVDRRLIHGLQRDVLNATRRVPYGRVATYGEIAQRIGRPRAARVVGRALGANGSLTGYGGGIERKARLLELEGSLIGL